MATFERFKNQKNMITTTMDVTDAMSDFTNGVANKRVLMGSAKKAGQMVMRPRIIQGYGSGPKKITGALSAKKATQTKGIWYKNSKTGVAIAGLKTKNISKHNITGKQIHGMDKWHANQLAKGDGGKYRYQQLFKPGKSITGSRGGKFKIGTRGFHIGIQRMTIAGNRPWKINDGVSFSTKGKGKRKKKSIIVTRNPSRISHLIEKGHKWPKGGKKATAFKVIENAERAAGNATKAYMMNEMKTRAKEAAERAAKAAAARAIK